MSESGFGSYNGVGESRLGGGIQPGPIDHGDRFDI